MLRLTVGELSAETERPFKRNRPGQPDSGEPAGSFFCAENRTGHPMKRLPFGNPFPKQQNGPAISVQKGRHRSRRTVFHTLPDMFQPAAEERNPG